MVDFSKHLKAPAVRVEDNAPARIEPQSPGWLQRNAERVRAERLRIDEALAPAAEPDRQADTIPDDLRPLYERLKKFRLGGPACILGSWESIELIERTGRAEAALREHHLNAISEDQAYQGSEVFERTVAALPATPSILKTGR